MKKPEIVERVEHSAKRRWRSIRKQPNLNWTQFPLVIQVDTNNYCGPKHSKILCQYCYPQWIIQRKIREHMEMPMEWIEWILREISRDGRTMSFIDWFLNGDGLTEPRLPEIGNLSKKLCPWLYTQTFTCGVRNNNIDNLLDANLDSICFTISGHTPELWSRVHKGNPRLFKNVLNSLETVLEKRRSEQNVEVHCVITEKNWPYLEGWWKFFGKYEGLRRILSPLVASYDNLPSNKAMGNLTLDQQETRVIEIAGGPGRMWTRDLIPDLKPCVLWDNMSVDVEGYVLQCCNWSPPQRTNYGLIPQLMEEGRTLKEVWLERLANRMRNPLCRSCNMKHCDWVSRLEKMKVKVTR